MKVIVSVSPSAALSQNRGWPQCFLTGQNVRRWRACPGRSAAHGYSGDAYARCSCFRWPHTRTDQSGIRFRRAEPRSASARSSSLMGQNQECTEGPLHVMRLVHRFNISGHEAHRIKNRHTSAREKTRKGLFSESKEVARPRGRS
jgi:hypothetical protein